MKKLIVLVLILLSVSSLFSCTKRENIKIGFVGSTTGIFSDLGVAGRNGAILRVEEINESGGINGREIELLIRDDGGDKEKTLDAFKELEAEGVKAIVGPSLSNNALHILDYIDQNRILTMGATITSSQLSGKDDYFFRVSQENIAESILQAQFLIENGQEETLALLDTYNEAYTLPWYEVFKEEYTSLGGTVLKEIKYSSSEEVDYSQLADDITKEESAALLTVTSAVDTAMISQQLRVRNHNPFFITSSWSKTEELIRQGGKTVEGIYTSYMVDSYKTSEKFKEFKRLYQDRFGEEPTFSANYNYDAVSVLLSAIGEVDKINADSIKTEILDMEAFVGVQGAFDFDRYGDVERDYTMLKLFDGKFVNIQE